MAPVTITWPRCRLLSSWFACTLLILLLFTACSPGQGTHASPSAPGQQASAGPSSVSRLLDPAPQHCPAGSSLSSKAIPRFNAPAVGSGPVWEVGLPPNATLNLNDLGYAPWPGTKLLWPPDAHFPATVTVRVTNIKTGIEAWWDIGRGEPPPREPVRPLILHPQGNITGGPFSWGTFLYLPQAGCYEMTVNWPGGQWRLLFAAGR